MRRLANRTPSGGSRGEINPDWARHTDSLA